MRCKNTKRGLASQSQFSMIFKSYYQIYNRRRLMKFGSYLSTRVYVELVVSVSCMGK